MRTSQSIEANHHVPTIDLYPDENSGGTRSSAHLLDYWGDVGDYV